MSSNLEIWPEIEPIEDNIEHEDSIVAPFDTDEFFRSINLFVTSKNETTNSPIHEFKVLQDVFYIL